MRREVVRAGWVQSNVKRICSFKAFVANLFDMPRIYPLALHNLNRLICFT